jgi:L-amino acid N-acyltransferase YncA
MQTKGGTMSEAVKETYRRLVTLGDGARILFRPLVAGDAEDFSQLYAVAQADDLLWLSENFADQDWVRTWITDLDYTQIVPLIAVINGRIVGDATVRRRGGAYNHIGDVRIFLAKDFRRRGLGTAMLETLIELSRKGGMHWLQAEVFANTPKAIRAFQSLGFQQVCMLEDHFMLPDGHTEDVVIMRIRLLKPTGQF